MQHVTITELDNGLGLSIPSEIVQKVGFKAGDVVELEPSEEGFFVRKTESGKKRYALADILDCFSCSSHRPEENFGAARGEEEW